MRFRTTEPHYIDDRYIAADTEIGTGTQYPLPIGYPPTAYMVPLDKEAEAAMRKTAPVEIIDPTEQPAAPTNEETAAAFKAALGGG